MSAVMNQAAVDDRLLRAAVRRAVALATDAARYFSQARPYDTTRLSHRHGLIVATESFRVTSRITHAVSWLLTQLAVTKGELTEAQARSTERRLGGHGVCLAGPEDASSLPDDLARLLLESERLFRRIARLDAAMDLPPVPPHRGSRPRAVATAEVI
ncbi:DUF1465 family protein [Zavarzinia sp. CC-PAN008]|uniref:DUF1465 family protein n=1 Tax=Zavarzinia sp. CC-PAN008 TaxID=3243332 RepID=UPI003F74633A